MNVYKVTGYVTWLRETTCEFCGQDYQDEEEQGIEVLVEITRVTTTESAVGAELEAAMVGAERC